MSSKTVETLNKLIECCEDAEKGFRDAAEGVQDKSLRTLFVQYSSERETYATELQKEVEALGEKPQESGSVAGAVHRGWINLKAALTSRNDHAILEECERGEDVAKAAYEKALQGRDLPGTLLPIVERQYKKVKESHDRVKALRDRQPQAAR